MISVFLACCFSEELVMHVVLFHFCIVIVVEYIIIVELRCIDNKHRFEKLFICFFPAQSCWNLYSLGWLNRYELSEI